jgi:endonuclease/exonuclease/phosphatase family metal-dependent hydrolase
MTRVCILDLNIWNYNEPWSIRRDRITELIQGTDPDLVALQEIRYHEQRPESRHQADQILDGLSGYTGIWRPAHYWPPHADAAQGGKQWEGLAILSRYPIVDQTVVHLSRDLDDLRDSFQRLVLGAQVRLPGGRFWLFNTHFPLSEPARNRVVTEAFGFMTQTANGQPFAFTGDLNARPEDRPILFLTGQAEIEGNHGNLIDAWTACHPGEPGYTFSAWDPQRRIDYVFVPSSVQVEQITVVGAVPGRETVSPSDHCGLLTILRIVDAD